MTEIEKMLDAYVNARGARAARISMANKKDTAAALELLAANDSILHAALLKLGCDVAAERGCAMVREIARTGGAYAAFHSED